MDENLNSEWKQHFPTYTFADKDIAKEEYISSSKLLESEERIFLNASNIALLFVTAVASLIIGYIEKISKTFASIIEIQYIIILLIALIIIFITIILKYFADRQRSIIFATRKIIILRRMLGLSYGSMQLILPNWRIEGADQPLSVKLFPGWTTSVAYPFHIISIISSLVIVVLILTLNQVPLSYIHDKNININSLIISSFAISYFYFMYIYRKNLLDIHESLFLLFIKFFSSMLNLKLVDNFEYIIYRAKLAKYETSRQHINLKNIKEILIFIEDKEFNTHIGISLKGILRGIKSLLTGTLKAGGSTITQQIVRTLFIRDINKTYRRKIIEIFLAIWFNKIISKDEQLEIYLSSVRFEKGVFGITEAMKFFWSKFDINQSKAQSFFLIERVSNIRSGLLVDKIIDTINNAKKKNILFKKDIEDILDLYKNAIEKDRIKANPVLLEKIREKCIN